MWLDEVQQAVKLLPNPHAAAQNNQRWFRVPIAAKIPVRPLGEEVLLQRTVPFIEFELVWLTKDGEHMPRWKIVGDVFIRMEGDPPITR